MKSTRPIQPATLKAQVFRYMVAVIGVTAVIRLAVWLAYQAFEVRQGHVVFHEQINEMLLLLLVEVLTLAVLGFMLWRLSRLLLSPLRSVANAARLISHGKLDKRIRTRHLPPGELTDIAEALNASFDRYQATIDRISRFSSAASHQLRTPLTAIQTAAESSLGDSTPAVEKEEALVSILEETRHLTRMTEQLLLLSRMEINHLQEKFEPVELNTIISEIAEVYQPVLEASQQQLEVHPVQGARIKGDRTLLNEALINLLDNANKFAGIKGRIDITLHPAQGQLELAVQDSGPGIAPEFREHLFERFERHPASAYKGTGLGLSIVHEVVLLHGGSIVAGSGPRGGAEFRITFPALPEAAKTPAS